MGGLDARWLIAHKPLGFNARIATLTALGTPHLGSPVASLLNVADPLTIAALVPGLNNEILQDLSSKANAVNDLSEAGAARIDKACPNDPTIRYFEVIGAGRPGTSVFFGPLSLYVSTQVAGPNDGVVPLSSATAKGTRHVIAQWPGDHADLIGHNLDDASTDPPFPYLAKYKELISLVTR
jgi:hypothetical protein